MAEALGPARPSDLQASGAPVKRSPDLLPAFNNFIRSTLQKGEVWLSRVSLDSMPCTHPDGWMMQGFAARAIM